MQKPSKTRNDLLHQSMLPAVVGSVTMFLLLAGRVVYSEELKYSYLVWNIFLAWLAWLLGVIFLHFAHYGKNAWSSRLSFIAWVLFLPNTFYLLTDMIHPVLSYDKIVGFNGSDFSAIPDGVTMLFDITLVGFCVWVGWYLGIQSLRSVWNWASIRFGKWYGVIMVQTIILASSYAIYLGRSPRLNSWDVVARPVTVLKVVVDPLLDPMTNVDAWGLTLLFVVAISSVFWSVALPQPPSAKDE